MSMTKVQNTENLVFKDIDRMVFEHLKTNDVLVEIEEVTNIQMTGNNDTKEVLGKRGIKLTSWETNKTFGIKANHALFSLKYQALQGGNKIEHLDDTKDIRITDDIVTEDGQTAKLKKGKAYGVVGNEIGTIYAVDNGVVTNKYTQGSDVSDTEFTYDPSTNEIKLPTGAFEKGAQIRLRYNPKFKSATRLADNADNFAEKCKVYIYGWVTDLCKEEDRPVLIVIPKGRVSGNLDFSVGESQAIQNIEVEALSDYCTKNKTLYEIYFYDECDIVSE